MMLMMNRMKMMSVMMSLMMMTKMKMEMTVMMTKTMTTKIWKDWSSGAIRELESKAVRCVDNSGSPVSSGSPWKLNFLHTWKRKTEKRRICNLGNSSSPILLICQFNPMAPIHKGVLSLNWIVLGQLPKRTNPNCPPGQLPTRTNHHRDNSPPWWVVLVGVVLVGSSASMILSWWWGVVLVGSCTGGSCPRG